MRYNIEITQIILAIAMFGTAISLPAKLSSADIVPKNNFPLHDKEHLTRRHSDATIISLTGDSTLRQSSRPQNDLSVPDKVFDLLKSSLNSRRRTARSASECRPTKIFKSDKFRSEPIWATLDCSSCKNSKGNSCSPLYAETRFLKYIGKSQGKDYFKYVTELIPSACDCS